MSFSYLPDLPPDTKDTWTVCDGFHADRQGNYRTGWLAASRLTTGLTENFQHVKCLPYGSTPGVRNIVALRPTMSGTPFTAGVAYVYNGSTWNNRVNGSVHTGRNESIQQYGNISLVGTPANGIYWRDATGTSNFAAIASSPNADVLLVNGLNIVVALKGNAWATSDTGDYTNFTTGESASGIFYQTPGDVTGGALLGRDVIAFKNRGVYRGSYVGGVVKWTWNVIDPNLGAWGPGCVVEADGAVYFYGDRGFWRYDGSRFERLDRPGISASLLAFLAGTPNSTYVNAKLVFDYLNGRIAFFRKSGATANGNLFDFTAEHYTFQIESQAWGYQSLVKDSGTDQYGAVVDGSSTDFLNGAPAYNSVISLFSITNNDIRVLTTEFSGSNYVPKLRTYRLGQRNAMTEVTRAVPQWTLSDGAGTNLAGAAVKTATPYTSDSSIETETAGTTVNLATDLNRADYAVTARYQSVEIKVSCEAVISGVDFEARVAGRN